MSASNQSNILLIECFYGGSHRQLIDLLHSEISGSDLITLPAKKWHWKARTGALSIVDRIPCHHSYKILFTSSVLNLTELIALRPDLSSLKKIVYFHENQLVYPVRKQQERDFQFGYNQILTCLVADEVLFNSEYNKESFLSSINTFLKLIPDNRPKGTENKIRHKCRVLYFPVQFSAPKDLNQMDVSDDQYSKSDDSKHFVTSTTEDSTESPIEQTSACVSENHCLPTAKTLTGNTPVTSGERFCDTDSFEPRNPAAKHILEDCSQSETIGRTSKCAKKPLHIVWPHRWEHDKDPDKFFRVLFELENEGLDFRLSVLGEIYTDVPDVFAEAKIRLKNHILHWGFLPSVQEYYDVLENADVVVSTAKHEFFGVAMLEAVSRSCYPLCPNNLVYPEIFPKCCLYNTENQLLKTLRNWCKNPSLIQYKPPVIDCNRYSWSTLESDYKDLFQIKAIDTA